MRSIFATPRFERKLRRFLASHAELQAIVEEVMTGVAAGRTAAVRTHALRGALKGCHAARISYEYRIVFVLEKESVCFIDIGTHDDVYR